MFGSPVPRLDVHSTTLRRPIPFTCDSRKPAKAPSIGKPALPIDRAGTILTETTALPVTTPIGPSTKKRMWQAVQYNPRQRPLTRSCHGLVHGTVNLIVPTSRPHVRSREFVRAASTSSYIAQLSQH